MIQLMITLMTLMNTSFSRGMGPIEIPIVRYSTFFSSHYFVSDRSVVVFSSRGHSHRNGA